MKTHVIYMKLLKVCFMKLILSHEVTSGSDITPCNQIEKPLVVYRFSGNVMRSIIMLHKIRENLGVFTTKMQFFSVLL